MTNREFFTNIVNGVLTEAEKEFATEAIAKLDKTNEARKNKVSPKEAEKAAADAAIREEIFGVLSTEPMIEADIAAAVGVTGPKARAELKKLVAEGRVTKSKVKVPKKGEVNGYAVASTDEVAEAPAEADAE